MMLLGLVELVVGFFFMLIDLLPRWTAPAAVQPGGVVLSDLSTLGGYASGFAYWIPFGAIGAAMAVVLSAFGIAFAIWAVRKMLSLVTLGKVS